MKRSSWLAASLIAAFALPAFAGHSGYHCKEDAQTCLNHMTAKMKNRGWLGVEFEGDEKKGPGYMEIRRVVQGSPAEAAGFQVGDVMVSVNGAKFADNTEEKCVTCEVTKENWAPGVKAQYVVKRGGREVSLSPTLAVMPSDVMAQMVGQHMIEHAATEVAEKK